MRLILPAAALVLFPLLAFGSDGFAIPSAGLDAYVQKDGSVQLNYVLQLKAGQEPVPGYTISLPSSKLRPEQIHAARCDDTFEGAAEQGGAPKVERTGGQGRPLSVSRHPDPRMDTEYVVDFGADAIPAQGTGLLCVDVAIPDYVSADLHCPGFAYVNVRPTFGSSADPTEISVAIHLPPGIPPSMVLGQQEWPQEQIIPWLPVSEEVDHAVVRWSKRGPLNEIYWVAAIFPGNGIRMKKAFDGLQTEIRVVPKETLTLDAFVREDGSVRLEYALDIDNSASCKPVDSVQVVFPGDPHGIQAEAGETNVPATVANTILDDLRPYVGTEWYQPYDMKLGAARIAPGGTGKLRVKTVISDELELFSADQDTVRLALNPTASATGSWKPGSAWTTRIHLPVTLNAAEVHALSSPFTSKEKNGDEIVVTWIQTKEPSPVDLTFPAASFHGIRCNLTDPAQLKYAILNFRRCPGPLQILKTSLYFLFPLGAMILFSFVSRILRRRS